MLELHDFDVPNCPECGKDEMYHLCVSHVPGTAAFRKNGWYCKSCKAGPKQLGSVTEADAARAAKHSKFNQRKRIMSKAVSYQEFCQHYQLAPDTDDSRQQYDDYCQNLDVFNDLTADQITRDAIDKAQNK